MMLGLQLEGPHRALTVTRNLLERGYLVLPAGSHGDVLQLTPPMTLTDAQLAGFVDALRHTLERR
jgi:acetylornithine/succinyldiaminopimelate/putrescine aminotransferase